MVVVYATYDVPRVVVKSLSNEVGVYHDGNGDNDKERTEILTAFIFELIKFDRRSRLVGGIGSEKRNDGERWEDTFRVNP